jgi:hypothetical protein
VKRGGNGVAGQRQLQLSSAGLKSDGGFRADAHQRHFLDEAAVGISRLEAEL